MPTLAPSEFLAAPVADPGLDSSTFSVTYFAQACDLPSRRRYLGLMARLRPIREAFVDLDELLLEYVHDAPARAEGPDGDTANFVGWLDSTYGLSPKQREEVRRVIG